MITAKETKSHCHPVLKTLTSEGLARLRGGHPWLFARHLKDVLANLAEPVVVPLGEHFFLLSPGEDLRLRRLGPATRFWPSPEVPREPVRSPEQFDQQFGAAVRALLSVSLNRRLEALPGEDCFRWIFSENDSLPGLTIDRFGSELVCQLQTAAIQHFWPAFRRAVTDVFRARWGTDPVFHEIVKGKPPADPVGERKQLAWNGFNWWMNPGHSQKTGAYLDQRDNHRRTAEWALRLGLNTAWDLCSFEGGFGMHLARAGLDVLAVDLSEEALATAERNALLNHIPVGRIHFKKAEIFEFLKSSFNERRKADLIVLDPPGFLKSASKKENAMRGYKELNLRAMHALNPGGLLVSCSCSHHAKRESYLQMLSEAAHDARRSFQILDICGPSPDHAPLLGFPEGVCLHAFYLRVSG